jgi:hypothetical protein
MDTMRAATNFQCKFPTENKVEMANMEEAIKRKRQRLSQD